MELKKLGKHQFMQNLSSSLLAPERCRQMYASYSGIPGDSDNVIKDEHLLSCYKQVFRDDHVVMRAIHQVETDDQYAFLTKGFVNVDATYSNLETFLTREENVVDRRYNENVKVAVTLLKEMMNVGILQPKILSRNSNIMDFVANGNAVCGTISSGVKKDHERILKHYALLIKEHILNGTQFNDIWIPSKGGHRAQLGNLVSEDGQSLNPMEQIKFKDRYVWAIDGGTGVVEAQYSMPLTQHLSACDFFSPGKEPHVQRSLIRNARMKSRYWAGIDYSRFDQTIPSWLIAVCFDIIKLFYDEQFHKEIGWIAYNFINTHVILPGGRVVQKDHGIPSGSGFTQIIGSMANMIIMLTYLSSKVSGTIEDKIREVKRNLEIRNFPDKVRYGIFAQGDDNLVFTKNPFDMKDLAEYAKKMFGVNINPEKCDQGDKSNSPVYLKREWRNFGEWQNPIYLVVNTIHPEHWRAYDTYSPWHIVYCLWLTYRYAFPKELSETYLIQQMREHGGVDLLLKVPRNALPGVAKAMPEKYREQVFRRAERFLAA